MTPHLSQVSIELKNRMKNNICSSFRVLFASLLVNLILMYIVYLIGKSLDSFIPCWIVWIILATNAIRSSKNKSSEQ